MVMKFSERAKDILLADILHYAPACFEPDFECREITVLGAFMVELIRCGGLDIDKLCYVAGESS